MSSAACRPCASRGILLGLLAGHIDRLVDGRVGERARDLLALNDADLARAAAPSDPNGVLRRAGSDSAHEALVVSLHRSGCWSTCRHRPDYPSSLEALGAAQPGALFGAGSRALLGRTDLGHAATIVGSRRAGAYGREVAQELARLLAASGITVISGMALGVDSAAHEGALAGSGETVAVLGTGPDRAYPRSRRHLFDRICSAGLVLSELPPGSPTFRWMFPARNRLMAAMAAVTVVVEAAERSGSLITAEMAIEGGRQVGAVPGPVTSWRSGGTNRLLFDGAAVIRDAQDVLDLLLGPGVETVLERGPALEPVGARVLCAVEGGARTPNAVAVAVGVSFPEAQAALGRLERDGYVSSDAAGRYQRTTRRTPANLAGSEAAGEPSTIRR
ncbi:MAG: DNA-protecting protein DprA [Solirubrobacterales bacterium]|nr:DNA-protecting protein DprA [Solirubrobacterales bacterium]